MYFSKHFSCKNISSTNQGTREEHINVSFQALSENSYIKGITNISNEESHVQLNFFASKCYLNLRACCASNQAEMILKNYSFRNSVTFKERKHTLNNMNSHPCIVIIRYKEPDWYISALVVFFLNQRKLYLNSKSTFSSRWKCIIGATLQIN